MFQGVQAYQGNLVDLPKESVAETVETAQPPQNHLTSTSDEILKAAKEEAALILASAQSEANEQSAAILAKAGAEAEEILTTHVLQKVSALNLELWSSRIAMADVIERALERVIGEIGYNEAALMAVETSLREYRGEHKLSVTANGRTIERLQLVAIGRGADKYRQRQLARPSIFDRLCRLQTFGFICWRVNRC